MSDSEMTLGEVGRRIGDLERVVNTLEGTVIRMQTIAEIQDHRSDRWSNIMAGVIGAIAGGGVGAIVSLIH